MLPLDLRGILGKNPVQKILDTAAPCVKHALSAPVEPSADDLVVSDAVVTAVLVFPELIVTEAATPAPRG